VIGRPGSAVWLLAYEARLGFREFAARYGRRGPAAWAGAAALVILAVAIGVPLGFYLRQMHMPLPADRAFTVLITIGTILLLMLSQTLVSAADLLYERGDLELVLASPVPPRRAMTVRFISVAASIFGVFAIAVTPILIVASVVAGPRWLAGLVVLACLALTASAGGLALSTGLFAALGPRRTRTLAQVVSALIGAAFFLFTQARLLLGGETGTPFQRNPAIFGPIDLPPLALLPVRAVLGEPGPLAMMVVFALALFALVVWRLGPRYAADASAAKGAEPAPAAPARAGRFTANAFVAVTGKEVRLLLRDPALLSQVLLRLLYLAPVTLILLRAAQRGEPFALAGAAAMVVFMSGQVAGSLAWITISAEEAPDLLVASPTPIATIRRAKLAAALVPLAVIVAPIVAACAWFSLKLALATLAGSAAAGYACALVNVWQQKPSRRSDFRRRRGASWYALWLEASVCGFIAVATAAAMVKPLWALVPAALAVGLLLLGRRSDAKIAEVLREAAT
jgi:ABC-2 type transport system permease protein